MANPNIDKTDPHRTGRRTLRVVEGKGAAQRQPLDLVNLTSPQLRELLGTVHGGVISDKDAEHILKLIRGMADKQATAPVVKDDTDPPDYVGWWGWSIKEVAVGAAATLAALPKMIEWYASQQPSDEREKALTVLRPLIDPLAAALPAIQFPLGEYERTRKEKECLWHLPTVLLANTLDRVVRRPDDTELPKFSRGASLTRAIFEIIIALKFSKPPNDPSAVSSYLESWWADKNHPRLPLGVAGGRELLRPAVLRRAKTPEAADALGQAADALEEVQRLLRERQKGE